MRRGQLVLLVVVVTVACGQTEVSSTTADPSSTTTAPAPVTTTSSTTTTSPSTTTTIPSTFERLSAPAIAPGTWDGGYAAVPHVIPIDDGYLMFYAGDSPDGAPGIGLARSEDGITWTKEGEGPVFTKENTTPSWVTVIEIDGTWIMYYTTGWTAGYRNVNRATAPDPAGPWTDEGSVLEAPREDWNRRILPTGITKIGDTFVMPYAGFDIDARNPSIGLFTSSDGLEWVTTDAPVYEGKAAEYDDFGIVPTRIIETDLGLELFFLGFDRQPGVSLQESLPSFKLGRLISTDGGETWNADNAGLPVFDTGEFGWPGVSVVFFDGEYLIYFGDDLGGAGIAMSVGTIP